MSIKNFVKNHKLLTASAAVGAVGVGGLTLLGSLWHYGMKVFPTADEKKMELPGDELWKEDADHCLHMSQAIDIKATPEQIWPYIAQVGTYKAGWYSFSWLERLCTFNIFNTYRVVPEWQDMKAGDFLTFHQCGVGVEVKEVKENEYFTSISDSRNPPDASGAIAFVPPFGMDHFSYTWNWYLLDNEDGTTRFMCRCDCSFEPFDLARKGLVAGILGTASIVMERRMMEVIRDLAEGKMNPEGYLNSIMRFFCQG